MIKTMQNGMIFYVIADRARLHYRNMDKIAVKRELKLLTGRRAAKQRKKLLFNENMSCNDRKTTLYLFYRNTDNGETKMNNKARQAQTIEQTALDLGIKITRAKVGTDIYTMWADRVQDAACAKRVGRMDRAAEVIEDANRHAI
jgi:hypothetical protein